MRETQDYFQNYETYRREDAALMPTEKYAMLLDSFLGSLLSRDRGSFIFEKLLRMDVGVPALPYRLNKFIIRLLQSDVQVFNYKFIQNILEAIVSVNETALVNLSTTGARTFIAGLK